MINENHEIITKQEDFEVSQIDERVVVKKTIKS